MEIKELNHKRTVIRGSNILLLILTLLIILIFLTCLQTSQVMDSPLIPEWTSLISFKPVIIDGLILSIGLLISVGFKIFKQHFWILPLGIITIVLTFI